MTRKWTLDYCLEEVINLKNILMKKFCFSPKNITLLSDLCGYKKNTSPQEKTFAEKFTKWWKGHN
jgi:hypothetical protein